MAVARTAKTRKNAVNGPTAYMPGAFGASLMGKIEAMTLDWAAAATRVRPRTMSVGQMSQV